MMCDVVEACRTVSGAPDLPPNQLDHAMWEAFGVDAACIYRLQCKCNHACDANAQSVML